MNTDDPTGDEHRQRGVPPEPPEPPRAPKLPPASAAGASGSDAAMVESLKALICRYVVYGLVFLGTFAALRPITRRWGADAFREGHFVELAHLGLAAGASVVMFFFAWRWPRWRGLLAILAGMAGFAAMREMDYIFTGRLPGGWLIPALLVAGIAVAVAWRDGPVLGRQVRHYVSTAAFGLMWAGVLTVTVFAQLVGHGPLLDDLVDGRFDRDVKRVVEESLELLGYMLVAMGMIELLLNLRRRVPPSVGW